MDSDGSEGLGVWWSALKDRGTIEVGASGFKAGVKILGGKEAMRQKG